MGASATTLPPGPEGRYLFGNLLEYAWDPLGFLTWCSRRYGDVVRLRFPGPPVYLLNQPDHIEYVLVENNRNFVKDRYTRDGLGILGNGLLTSDGGFWRRQRRLSQPAFHRERINAYAGMMVDYTERMISTWRDGETRDIHRDMMRLTLQIVAKTLIDADIAREAEGIGSALGVVMRRSSEQGSSLFLRMIPESIPTPGNLRFRRASKRLDGIVHGIVNERRESGKDTGDLLSMLLHARDEEGNRMSDEQLRDEVMTIVLAGHETTVLALTWTWYLLSKHPEAESRLLAELQEVLNGRAPTVEDQPRLRYADMVIKESMRLYPPAWAIGREAINECEIGGYRVPAESQLFISQWVVHRDPRFFENPEAFDPDRWRGDLDERIPRYAYFPFGGGPRLCIGRSFARMEAVLLLAAIAQKFRIAVVGERPAVPQPSITLRPRGGMRATLSRR